MQYLTWRNPANIRLDEDVLKTFFVFIFRRRLQDFLIKTNMFALALRLQKTSSRRLPWSRPIYSSWLYVFKTPSRRLQNVLPRRLQDVLQRRLQDIFKTFLRRFEDVFKTSSRRLKKRLQDIFKTSSRRLEDVFKTSSRRLTKISSTRFQEVSSS